MKFKLVDDWQNCWKWLSIHLSILGMAAAGMWDFIPALQETLPAPLMTKILLTLFALIFIGRLIRQGNNNDRIS